MLVQIEHRLDQPSPLRHGRLRPEWAAEKTDMIIQLQLAITHFPVVATLFRKDGGPACRHRQPRQLAACCHALEKDGYQGCLSGFPLAGEERHLAGPKIAMPDPRSRDAPGAGKLAGPEAT